MEPTSPQRTCSTTSRTWSVCTLSVIVSRESISLLLIKFLALAGDKTCLLRPCSVVWSVGSAERRTLQLLFITGLDGDTVSEVLISAGARPNDNNVTRFVIININIRFILYRREGQRLPHNVTISNVLLGSCAFNLRLVGSFIFIEEASCFSTSHWAQFKSHGFNWSHSGSRWRSLQHTPSPCGL